MKCQRRTHSIFLLAERAVGSAALIRCRAVGSQKASNRQDTRGRADNRRAALAAKTDIVWTLRANLKNSYRTSLRSIDDHAESSAEMQRGLRLIAGQYRNQTVFHHAAFAIFGKMTVELKVGLRSVIDQGLAKARQGHGYRRIADEGTLFYQVTVECQHVGACIYQLADQIG